MVLVTTRAVKAFLAKPRDDLREWKSIPDEEIEYEYEGLPKTPPIWGKLRKVQKICFLIGALYKRVAFHLDTGSGKSLLSLSLIRYLGLTGDVFRTIVLVPRNVNKYEWVREIKKHSPNTSYVVLSGSSERKWKLLEEADDEVIVATYAGLVRMVCTLVDQKKSKKQKLKPDPKLIKRLLKSIDGLVCDEASELGNRSALAWRVCRKIAEASGMVIELTGTPFGRDPTPLWSQMYLVDQGESLGTTLGMFRAAFFTAKENYWSGFPDYVFDKKNEGILHRALAHRSIRYEADEQDLPDVVRIVKEVHITKDIAAYYEKAKKQLMASHGNYQEMQNAFIRMRQISSGFVGYYDDEVGARAEFEFKPNPKLDMLLGIAESIPHKHKAVIFHDFVFSGSIICRELENLELPYARVYGKTKDPDAQLQKFVSDPECRFFVLNAAAGAFGLNLQIAKYAIFYESPVPVIIRKQAERRVERQYSEHDLVFIYDLVSQGTYDQRILDNHESSGDLFRAIVDGKERI